jgi:HEAT repeat protein
MEQLTPHVMHRLVFTILVHGLPDNQSGIALEVLNEALRSPNSQVRELAVVALSELNVAPAKRVAGLSTALRDPNARVRRRAARSLGDFGPQALPMLPLLIDATRDPDSSVRRDAAGSLGRFGPAAQAAAPGLVRMLADFETRTRVVAAFALKRIGRAAVAALLQGLDSPSTDLRRRCATLLGQLAPGDEKVADAIRKATIDAGEDFAEVWQTLTPTPVPVATPGPRIGFSSVGLA